MTTRLRVATSGKLADAVDVGGTGAIGQFLRRVLNATPGQPDTVDWAASSLLPAASQMVWVSKGGSDVTGDGSFGAPFLTIAHAQVSILDAAAGKPYVVYCMPGNYAESILFRNFVFVMGSDSNSTTTSLPVGLSADFTATPGSFGGLKGFGVNALATFDATAVNANGGSLAFADVVFGGNVTLTGNDVLAMANLNAVFDDCELQGDYVQNGCVVTWYNTSQNAIGGPAFHITNQLNQNANFTAFGGGSNGFFTAESLPAPVVSAVVINFLGTSVYAGGMSKVIGAGGVVPSINANFGDSPENPSVGAAGNANRQMRLSHQFVNIAPNPTAIAANAVTTILLAMPVGLVDLFNAPNPIENWHLQAMPANSNWGALTAHEVAVWFYFYSNAGVPTVAVNFYNGNAAPFNITDSIDLNVSGYLPEVL